MMTFPQPVRRVFTAALAGLAVASAGVQAATAAVPSPLASMSDRVATMSAYRASIALFERQGTREQRATYDYTFVKPNHVTLHVNSGESAGDTLNWDGGSTVVAHKSGLFSAFKKSFGLHDAATTTIRGSSVDQLSFAAIVAHIHATPGTLSETTEVVEGVPTTALTLVPASPASNGGYTREIVDLSTTTHLPVRVLGYTGSELVRQIDFTNVTAGPEVKS